MLEVILPVFIFIALLIIAATVLPLARVDEWWVRVFDFPRLQIFSIGAVIAVGIGYLVFYSDHALGKWVFMAFIACLIYQGFRMYDYTRLAPKQSLDSLHPRHEDLLSILTANVYIEQSKCLAVPRLDIYFISGCGVRHGTRSVVGGIGTLNAIFG